MAKGFNLTAELNLRGPSNIKNVVSQIRKQLGTINADVSLKIDPKASKNIDIISKKLQVMNTALVQARANSNNLNSSLRDLAISMETIKNTGTTSASSIQKTASSLKNTTKATKEATDSIQEFGKQSALAVRRFAAFSIVTSGIYGLINAITSGTKAFIDFDRQIVKLQQVTGKSKSELSSISDEITRLATNLGVSSSSLIEVASTLAQAGISAKDTKIALEALAKTELAPSFDNLKETTEGAIAAIRQFGLETSELESALGSINAVAAAFAVESSDIIAAIQRTGGVFASASKGVSEGTDALNEFIAVFTSVRATTRESAETIATGLRTIFTRIQRGKTIEQLKQFGVELQDLEGKFVGPFEAVKRLSEALNQLDPRDIRFSSIIEELGGFRQIGKVIPLIQQFATAQEALKVAQRGQDSLTNAQITAQQSLANQLAKVREQFLALVREVGQSSAFQKLFKIITGLSGGFISLLGAFKPILPLLGLLAAIKGLGAITKFGSGLFQGLGKGGASQSGQNIGESFSGAKEKEKAETTARAAEATKNNTNALVSLTSAIQSLENKIISMGSSTLITPRDGGRVLGFNKGGVVPGSGRGDKVPALLEPGEVVMNNSAGNKYGRGNLVRMNKYVGGGKVNITAEELKGRSRSSKAVENLITDDKDTALYGSGRAINTLDNISFNRRIYKLYDEDSVNDWNGFEEAVQKRVGGTRTNIGKNDPSFPIDIIGSNLGPLEVRNRSESTSNRTLLDKLIRYYISKPDFSKLQNRPTPDDISLGNIGVVYNSAKYDPPNAKELMTGGKIQKLMAGSPGGIRVPSGKGRGVKGAKGARSKFKDLNETELAQLSTRDLIAYAKDQAEDVFTTGGAGLAIANEFISVPQERIIPELESELTTYLGQKGFWREKIAPFGSPERTQAVTERKMDVRTLRNMVATAGGVDSSALEDVPMDALLKYAEQAPRAPKEVLEKTAAKYASISSIKPKFQEWGKNSSSGVFADIVSGLEDQIRDQLEEPNRSRFDSLIAAGSLDAYKAAGGKDGHIPPLKKAIYETIGVTEKSAGGLIQKFMAGSTGGITEETIDSSDIIRSIERLGGPGSIRQLIGVDKIKSSLKDFKQPPTAKQLFSKTFLNSENSAPYLSTIGNLVKEAEGAVNKPRVFSQEEKNNATKLAVVGLTPFDLNEFKFEELAGRIVSINSATLKSDKAPAVEQMRSEIDRVLNNFATNLGGQNLSELDASTKEAIGLGNLEGYMIEAVLAKLGANPGKLDDRSVDYAGGLGRAASLFGVDPNIPTEVKRDVKGGLSKARVNFANYFDGQDIKELATGGGLFGRSDGPGFEEIRQQIIDKYPEIDFGIRKRKKSSGFGYNLTGALKATGGLSGKDSVNFQQPTNLKQLQEYADKLASKLMNPEEFAIGGLIKRFASGGTVPAMVSNGEAFVPPQVAKKIGYAKLDKMNQADRNGMKGFAAGGISTFKGAGNGTSDSIGPIGLPTGSYVIREKATKALGLNKGGSVGIRKFEEGGRLSKDERKRRKEEFLATQRGGITRLEARSVGMPRPDFGAGASRKRDVMATPQGEINVKNIETEVLNNYKKLYAEEKKRIDELYTTLQSETADRYFKGEINVDEFNTTIDDLVAVADLSKKQAKDKLTVQAQTAQVKAVEEYKTGKQAPAIEQRKSADAGTFSTEVQSSMDQVVKEAKAKYEALYSEEKQSLKDYYQAKAKNVADEGGDVAAVIDEYKAAIGELKQSIKSGFGTEVKEKQAQVPEQIAEQKTQQVQSLRDANAVDSTYLQAQEAKAKADLIAAEQAEFFAFKAKQAGLTTEQYQRKLSAETVKLAKDLATDLKAKQIDLKQSTINVGAGLKGRARDGSDEDKSFIKKAENTIIEKLQAINPTAQLKDLEVTAGKLVDQMISADVSFEDLTQNNTDLAEALNKTYTEAEATAEAMKAMSDKTGMAVEILENQIGDMVDSRRTTMGAFKANAADVVDSLGGPVRVLGIGMTIVADQVGQLITSLDSNSKQNVGLMTALGAFTGAAQGMVAGQVIGAEGGKLLEKVFPDLPGLGKKFEIVSTSIGTAIGLIKGAADAYYRSKLDIVLANIAKSGQEVDIAFERLAKNNTPENLALAQKALKDSSQNIMDLADRGNIGAGGTSRTILEWMRGLDRTGITGSVSGQATEKEARESFVGEVSSQVQRASQVGDVRIKQVSGKEIEASVKQIQEFDKQIGELKKTGGAGAEAAIKDVQAAKQEFLGTRSQVFGQLREIYATDKDAFLALYIESAKKSGMTAEQIADAIKTPKGLKEAIQKGKEISASYAEQEQRARLLADASRKVVIATQNILNVYRLLEANLTRFGGEITNIVSDVNQLTSAYEGNATIQAPRRTDEQIFSNISAYNEEEVAGAASRAGALAGGGQRGADLERRIIGAKTIKDELPKILQGITSSDADEAMEQIADKFKSMGIELDPAVFDQLAKTLQSKLLGQEGGATAAELAEDPALLESLSKISEETLKSAGMMAKAFNDAMSSTVDLINKYGQSIEQATEWQLKAANIRLNAENQLAQTLGQNLTLEQLNAPQESRIRGLTASNVLPGGSMDPNQIFRSRQTMIEDTPNQEKELEKRRLEFANAASDTERDRAKKAVDDQIKYMANQNAAINNSQKALEELANDSQAASNALNKLGEQQKLAQASTNMMQKVLTSTPTELNDINKQISAYTKMISGGATDRDIGSLDFRQAAFGGLNAMQSLMPENIQRQMQAKMTREMLSRMPGGQQLLETKTGALGPDGEPMTMGKALNLTETGRDPIQEQYLNEYAAATQRQADAADRLGDSAIRVGKITVVGVDRILTKLSEELPKQYGKAVEQSTPKPVAQTNTTPAPSDPLMPNATGTQNLVGELGKQSKESTGYIVDSIVKLTSVAVVGFAALKMSGGMGALRNIAGRIPGLRGAGGAAAAAGKVPGGTMGAQAAKTAAASAGRATATGAASAGRATAGGIGSTALNAVKTGANSVGVAVNSAGKALAGFSSSFAGQMIAFNTGMSVINNAIAFASNPQAYVAGLQEKSDAELRMVQQGQMGVAMLHGAMEGLSDPIGKIAEGVVTLKGLADDFADAAAREAKNKRIEEQGKERRVKERGGKDKNQELSRLSTQEANRAMNEAQTTVELKALKDIQARGGSVEDFAKLTGSSTNAFIDPNTGKQMDINELIKQRETALSTYGGKKSEDYKKVVDKEVQYREQKLEEERSKQDVVVENTAIVAPPPPPTKPAEIQTQAALTAETKEEKPARPAPRVRPPISVDDIFGDYPLLRDAAKEVEITRPSYQPPERFIPPPSRPVIRAEATAPLQQTNRKPNVTTIAIKKQEALETQASVDQLELVKLSKEAEIAKKAKKLKTTRIAAVGAGTLKTSEKVATAQSSVDMAQQDLAGINKQITAEKQRLASIAEQIRLEKAGPPVPMTSTQASDATRNAFNASNPQQYSIYGAQPSANTVDQGTRRVIANQTTPIPSQNDNRQTQGTQSIRSPGETTGYSLSIDEKTTQFLSSLQTTFNSFGDYITRLEKASSNIPDKIDLVLKTEPIEVKITGGAVIEALQSVPEFIQDMINKSIKEKTKSLTDMWNTTGGALGSNPRS